MAVGGPVAEIPFMAPPISGWHYLTPDYYPLSFLAGSGGWRDAWAASGISSLTGPCYFAVTTDAIALGRWFASDPERADKPPGL